MGFDMEHLSSVRIKLVVNIGLENNVKELAVVYLLPHLFEGPRKSTNNFKQ